MKKIQAEIFDHFFAALKYFELRAFQRITGSDLVENKDMLPQ